MGIHIAASQMAKCVSSRALHFLSVPGAVPLPFTPLLYRRNISKSLSTKVQSTRMSNGSSIPWEVIVPQASCSKPKFIMRHEILNLLEAGQTPGTGFLLVDVRREDHQGSSIAGSVNMPIQTLFQSLPTLIRICIGGKIDRVIFYCGEDAPHKLSFWPVLQSKRTETLL